MTTLTLVQEQYGDDCVVTVGLFTSDVLEAKVDEYITAINDRNDDFTVDARVYLETKTDDGFKRQYSSLEPHVELSLHLTFTPLTVNDLNEPV